MKSGDLVALFKGKFQLSVAINSANVTIIYKNQEICDEAINKLIDNISLCRNVISTLFLSTIGITNEMIEIYNTNLFTAIQEHQKTVEEFFNVLKVNLKKINTFEEGSILRMSGFKLIGLPIYQHHVIFSGNDTIFLFILLAKSIYLYFLPTDAKKFKIIHKHCELNFKQLFLSLFSSGKFENVRVQEDNLLDLLVFREAFIENSLDQKYKAKYVKLVYF